VRIGLIAERKVDRPDWKLDPSDWDSETLAGWEEDELVAGLRDAGHQVFRLSGVEALLEGLDRLSARTEIVFNRSVGFGGLEGKMVAASILEAGKIPYVGSSPWSLGLTRHKLQAKLAVSASGVRTPPAVLWDGGPSSDLHAIPYPVLVKPVAESSSIGIDSASVASDPEAAVERARWIEARYRQPALIESFVYGVDVEVPILVDPSPRALGCVALTCDSGLVEGKLFLGSDEVYRNGYGFAGLPPGLDGSRVEEAAVHAARVLGIRDYGRIDFRVTSDGSPWFIEASTHPHLQKHSSFFFLAERRGLLYPAMLDEIVQVAWRRHQNSISQSA
jgi:D-alanine-D-alanine ligase